MVWLAIFLASASSLSSAAGLLVSRAPKGRNATIIQGINVIQRKGEPIVEGFVCEQLQNLQQAIPLILDGLDE